MNIPSKSQWGSIEKNNLDAKCAFKNFIGKSFLEAEEMFKYSYYQEDLLSMPSIAFNYYAPAYASYIVSKKSKNDADAASCFLGMVIELLQGTRHEVIATKETLNILLQAAKSVSEQQSFYGADIDIYGEFISSYNTIIQLKDRT